MRNKNVIFVCTGNSCRSQMAEGWTRQLHQEKGIQAFSAGTNPRPIDPLAVRVMSEVGVDISAQESHRVDDFLTADIDLAVLLCSDAAKECPRFPPPVRMLSRPFDDPRHLVRELENEAQVLDVYRRVRDEIRELVSQLPRLLSE